MKKLIVDKETITKYLPPEPAGYHYEVEKDGNMWHKVWLVHHKNYVYAEGGVVKTIHSFIKKNGEVHPPLNHKKPHQRKVLCQLVDLGRLSSYTSMVTKPDSPLLLL